VIDVVLHDGIVLDGTGTAGFRTDVAIAGDAIVRIGQCAELDAALRLDCTGLCVAPGFIDMHGHSDELLFANPLAESKIRQGITTEIGGNCGSSPGPLSDDAWRERRDRLSALYGIDLTWRDMEGFFEELERRPAAINFCCLAGLGDARAAAGFPEPGKLDRDGQAKLAATVRIACEQGAIGISSGLIYPPGSFADLDELVAAAIAARSAGSPLYATHVRSEGDALVEAIDEALSVGRGGDVAVQLSHHKASGKQNWGKVHDTLAHVDRARDRGLDVVLDQYPYKASSTGLDVILPADVNVGSRPEIARRLADKRYAALVAARVELAYAGRWGEVLIAAVVTGANKSCEGKTIAAIASERGVAPVRAALDLLVEETLDVAAIYFTMCEDDVRTVLSYPHTCIGSDSSVRSPTGPASRGKPHPRAYGTFPRLFKRYVRDARLLGLAEAVRRATSLPASRIGLRRRGLLAEGWFADVVVFDPERIADTATYEDPHRFPDGVAHVLVNGVTTVRGGATTGSRPGRVLRRGRDL